MKDLLKGIIFSIIIFSLSVTCFNEMTNIESIISPFKIPVYHKKQEEDIVSRKLRFLNVSDKRSKELTKSIKIASSCTGIKEELLIALMKTESDFKSNAVSSKGYKGLMQTPKATFEYPEVDTLYGAKILQDKLKYANGDLLQALTLYKGGNNSLARKYAKETLKLYEEILKNG